MKYIQFFPEIFLALLFSIIFFFQGFAQPETTFLTGKAASTIENITICNNQLPYSWNGINCLTAGSYSVTLTGSNGTDSVVALNLSVIDVGTSITNAIICNTQLPYHWNGNVYLVSGTYSVTLTSSSGCDSVPILSLTVNDVVTSTTNQTICNNQLPFNWNGINYINSGSYNTTLTSVAGCDSVATLNLAVKPVTSGNSSIAVCVNQLPYLWNGQSYPTAGTYTLTLTGSNGCDSIATLQLETNTTSSSNTAVTICNNQLPYSWNGNAYTSPGTYTVNLSGSAGCDSIANINLTAWPAVVSTTNVRVCLAQLPYSWNGQSYNVAGVYAVTFAGAGSHGCDSVARLNLAISAFVTSTTIRIICIDELPFSWNGNSYSAGGTYSVNLLSAAGCDSIATLNLQVDSVVNTELEIIICSGDLPFSWNGQVFTAVGTYPVNPPVALGGCDLISSLSMLIQPIIPSTTLVSVCNNRLPFTWNGQSYTAAGVYGVALASVAGCDSLANLDLTIINTSGSVSAITICNNELPYLWNGNIYNAPGSYAVTLTAGNGCDSVATLNLQVKEVSWSTADISICSAQLPFSWNGNTYNAAGIYTATLLNANGCDSMITLTLAVQPFVNSTTNIAICNNQLPYTWNGQSYNAAGTYTVTLTSAAGCDSLATLNLASNPNLASITDTIVCSGQLPVNWNGNLYPAAGSYNISLLSANGCDSVATLNIVIGNAVTTTSNITICNNQLPYNWNGNSYAVPGIFPVTLTGSSGCDSIAIINLVVTDILTSTTNVTVCNSQLPYSWNGNNYAAGGTYSVTQTTGGGCDSVPILSLTVIPYVTSTSLVVICNDALPYSWNGESYTEAGTYSVFLVSNNGCDSLAGLILEVNSPATSNTEVNLCYGQLPYLWNGNSYNMPGSYSIILQSNSGCDSVATLILTEADLPTSLTEITVCDNSLPYFWNGNVYPSAGTYTLTLVAASGCDSIATLNLGTNSTLTSHTTIQICTTQLPYSWNGNIYQAAGSYQVNLVSSTGCDSLATLVLIVNATVTSNSNVSICNNQFPYNWNGNSYPDAGVYPITLSSSGGCDSIATLDLHVIEIPLITTSVAICVSELPYAWNGQLYSTPGIHNIILTSSAGCDSSAILNLIINTSSSSNSSAATCSNQLPFLWNGQAYNSPGSYQVTLTNSSGCDSVVVLELIINPVDSTVTNFSICSGQLPYNWNGQVLNASGIYHVTLSGSAGCDSIATLYLTVNPTPGLPNVNSPVIYCQQDVATQLSANITTPGSYLSWSLSALGGQGSLIPPVPSTLLAGSTNYYVSQVDGNCEGPKAIITVTINRKPTPGPDKTITLCFGQSANLFTYYDTTGLISSWTVDTSVVANAGFVTTAGNYELIAENVYGCRDTSYLELHIQPELIADAGEDADIEYNFPYQLTGSGGSQYQWAPANLLNNPFTASPITSLTGDVEFVLMVLDEVGCMDLDSVKLRVLNGPTFYVPTAFTPDSDGLNDVFKPIGVGISKLDFFRIFNRLGQLVFETNEIGKGWDGNYKGQKQNPGNFVWSLKGLDRKGVVKTMKGNVVLIR